VLCEGLVVGLFVVVPRLRVGKDGSGTSSEESVAWRLETIPARIGESSGRVWLRQLELFGCGGRSRGAAQMLTRREVQDRWDESALDIFSQKLNIVESESDSPRARQWVPELS
jgi:hypothetical protein